MQYDYQFGNKSYNYCGKVGIQSTKYEIMAPEQEQKKQPGVEYLMTPKPIFDNPNYIGSNKLKDKVAIITGGDSGLGRAAAIAFAKEGANVVIPYLDEHVDANETKNCIEKIGRKCLLLSGDITDKKFCKKIVECTLENFGKIDILVNNAGVQYQADSLEQISDSQFDRTMKVNIYGMFYLTREVLPYLKCGASIINLTSSTFTLSCSKIVTSGWESESNCLQSWQLPHAFLFSQTMDFAKVRAISLFFILSAE